MRDRLDTSLRLFASMALVVASILCGFGTLYASSERTGVFALLILGICLPVPLVWLLTKPNARKSQNSIKAESGIIYWRNSFESTFFIFVMGFAFFMGIILFIVLISASAMNSLYSSSLALAGALAVAVAMFIVMKHAYRIVFYRSYPLIMLDNMGLHFWRPESVMVPWPEITSARLTYANSSIYLLVGLAHPERYIDAVNRWGTSDLWIALGLLKGSARAVLQAIREHPLYRGKSD